MFSQLDILHKMGRNNFDLGLKLFGATNHISQAITQEILYEKSPSAERVSL
jgi:hypothetical protein